MSSRKSISEKTSESDTTKLAGGKTFSDLPQWRRYGLLVAISVLTALERAQRNLLTPFYSNNAMEKHISESGIGMVFGSLDFAACGSCIIWTQVLQHVSVKYVYTAAIVGSGTFSGLFAVLVFVKNAHAFLATSIVFRVLIGFFTGAYFVAESVVLLSLFPENMATISGIMKASAYIGSFSGPIIGGLMYQYGGFATPFSVTSAITLTFGLSVLTFFPMTTVTVVPRSYNMLRNPVFVCCLGFSGLAMGNVSMVWAFFSIRLEHYGLDTPSRSIIIALNSAMVILFSIISGQVIDKKPNWAVALAICGFSGLSLFNTLFAPAPYYNISSPPLSLIIVCWAIMGVTGASGVIGSIMLAYRTVKRDGYPDTPETYGLVAGYLKASESLGSGLSTVFGGLVNEAIGWEWMVTGMGFMIALQTAVFTGLMLCKRFQNQTKNSQTECDDDKRPFGKSVTRYH